MNKRNLVISLVAALTVVVAAIGYLALGNRPRLGLDLQGGISAVYTPVLQEGKERTDDFDEVLDETISIIRDRVDSLGVAEPEISRQGDDVLVQLPGLEDPDRAREIIGTTAKLTFRPVQEIVLPGTAAYDETPACDDAEYPVPEDDEGGIVCSADDEGVPLVEQPPAGETGTTGTDTTGGDATGTEPPATGEPTDDTSAPADDSTGASSAPASGGTTGLALAATTGDTSASHAGRSGPVALADVAAAQDTGTATTATAEQDAAEPQADATPDATGTSDEVAPADNEGEPGPTLPLKYRVGPAALTGDGVEGALATIDTSTGGGSWIVQLDLDAEGGDQFAAVTGELACRRDQGQIDQLAIVLDGRVESAPSMNPGVSCGTGITGGTAVITVGGAGSLDGGEQEARDLALVLKTGALPITLEPSTFQTVSPTLGEQSLQTGLIAGLVGLALVAIYLLFFYRWLGLVAIGALAIFGVVMFGLLTLLGEIGFTLTLAGIAGIVVSIGITADSSIIFFERIRDEVNLGKTMRTAVKRGFESAFRTNLAGNAVTLAAAVILYFLAVGPVRGFALTLGIATVLDILILYFYTRPAVGLLGQSRRLTRRSIRAAEPTPVAGGSR